MKISDDDAIRFAGTTACIVTAITLLSACGFGRSYYHGKPYLDANGQVQHTPVEIAHPQVAYRIDNNRFFEIVPYGPGACTNAVVYFNDKAKGIRSAAVNLDPGSMGAATLIIDASNDQFLVAPVTRGNIDCSSGGGYCGGSKLPYSTDGGRTWKRADPKYSGGHDVYMSGQHVYNSAASANMANLEEGAAAWKNGLLSQFPAPIVRSLDAKFQCTPNGKE